MKKLMLLLFFAAALCMAAEGPVFHFDFSKAAGKRTVTDRTGKFRCLSDGYDFQIVDGGLRIAPEAKFTIPMPIKANGGQMSFSLWLVTNGKTHDVIFFKGLHPYSIEYALMLDRTLPEFCYKNRPGQNFWKGIYCVHGKHTYPTDAWNIPGVSPQIVPDRWTHLVYTFDSGTIRIYLNGVPVLEQRSKTPERLKTNTLPGLVGADKVYGEKDNDTTANLLVNDLQLYNRALSGAEVKQLYLQQSPRYVKTPVPLRECLAYRDASVRAFDPEFAVKLPITAEYEQRLKTAPPKFVPVARAVQKTVNGKVGLFLNDQQVYPLVVIPGIPTYIKPHQRMGCYSDFAAAGVKLQNSGYLSIPRLWTGEGKFNWTYVDQLLAQQLRTAPDGKIMVYLFVSAPEWYYEKHPEDREQYYANGKLQTITYRDSMTSERVLAAEVDMLQKLVQHIEKSPYGKHVFAYLVGGGGGAEWYWPAHWEGVTGYSPTTQRVFRDWVKRKYNGDVSALRKAWRAQELTFETVAVPLPAERRKADLFCFKDPQKNRPSMDWEQFMNDMTVNKITTLCKTVKTAAEGRKLVYTYNGYCMLYHGKSNPQNTALRRFTRVIDCPYIDGFATPMDYDQRRAGEPSLNINAFHASAKLRGKSVWKEDDLRTHFLKQGLGRTANLKETLEVVRLCFANSLVTGGGFWYYSLNHPALFHQEEIMRSIGQISRLAESSLKQDVRSTAEVALIVDEDSLQYLAYNSDPYLIRTVWGAYLSAARMGAPFDTYLSKDLADPKMPDYKLYVFLNNYHADKAKAEIIARKVRKNNAVSVWCYAPGFFSEQGTGTARMKELTGMDFTVEYSRRLLGFDVRCDHVITRGSRVSDPVTAGPLFQPSAPGLKVLARAGGKPALAVKEFPQWRSVYSMIPLDKELLMGLCDYAGVHVFSRSFDVFSGNRSYLALHTSSAGPKRLQLRGKYRVRELFTGKDFGGPLSEIREVLPEKTTRIYQLIPAGR